jgi:hypothetical protein
MIPKAEKDRIWQQVSKEFPYDPGLRDIHFIRQLMVLIRKKLGTNRTFREIGLMAREEFAEWLAGQEQ